MGSGGAGKTTLATRLGPALGLPVVHLDRHYWSPGWVSPAPDEWATTVRRLTDGERWVMDGNYGGSVSTRLTRAQAVVLLDFPPWRCLLGILARRLASARAARPDLHPDLRDRLTPDFVWWVLTYPWNGRVRMERALAATDAPVFRLRSRREVEDFLGELAEARGTA